MGHTVVKVRVYNPSDGSKSLDLELLVDAGSTYTWIRNDRLVRLNISPIGRRRFRTIEGRIIVREIGEAVVECMGRRATTIVVFAEKNDSEVLGLHALEGLGLEVDPITRQLKEVEAILAL